MIPIRGRRRAVAALACLLTGGRTRAQPVGATRRVGVLGVDPVDGSGQTWEAFVDELARRGYVEGRNLILERRFGESSRPDQLQQRAEELVGARVEVIYATTGAALAAKAATNTIPIVFFGSNDPVAAGLVQSLSRPSGNATGNATQGTEIVSKGLQILAQATGRTTQFVLFVPPGLRSQATFVRTERQIGDVAAQLGMKARFVEVVDVGQLGELLKGLVREGVDAVLLFDFPMFRPHLGQIADMLIERKLPSYGDARAGFLLHYDISRTQLARNAAAYVDRILKGAKPADLPVEQATVFELIINQRTARALGIDVPRSLLLRADEVIG